MSQGLDSAHIRRAADRAAAGYDAHAVLQREVGARLRERLELLPDLQPATILDVGSATGEGAAALQQRWPQARLVALDLSTAMLREGRARRGAACAWSVCGDAQALPLATSSVDLVHANLCLQWCEDAGAAIAGFRRVLRPGGVLLFSTFGPDTLKELRDAAAAVDRFPHVSRFIDMHHIGDALLVTGFRDPVMEREDFILTYPDAAALLRDLKGLGATNADAARRRALTAPGRLRALLATADEQREEGGLPITWEVVYGHALAPDPGQPERHGGEDVVRISLDSLRGSRRR